MTEPMHPYPLINTVRPYAWGSRDFIASLQGRPAPSPTPEAELWMGAHPAAPSELEAMGRRLPLPALIAAEPEATLGRDVATRFAGELPFLMKVLAAAQPLSLQVHPDRAQARAGFAAEEAAGVPLSAPERCYKDRNHKPELIVALTPFVALYGFRPVMATRRLIEQLGIPELAPLAAALDPAAPGAGLRAVFERLLAGQAGARLPLADTVRRLAAADADSLAGRSVEGDWLLRLARLHPGDVGVLCALFLNLVELRPGEALYLPAGNLHAYLEGAGVEIMASSDNVLRGGLTPKPVNVPELLRVLRFDEIDPTPLRATPVGGGEHVYATAAEEFELSFIDVDAHDPAAPAGRAAWGKGGPEIWLATEGQCRLDWAYGALELARGASAFVPAGGPAFTLGGRGRLFRARVPGVA